MIVVDIKSMFHQVKVREQDQDSLRFLWWDGSTNERPDEYVMTVDIFGATDSPSTTTLETLRSIFYVDDVLRAVPTSEAAIKMSNQLLELCARGGFSLRRL